MWSVLEGIAANEKNNHFYFYSYHLHFRAHLNDLENIIPYILISFTYVLTDPLPDVAVNLFRIAVASRLWHTFVYAIYVIPQPARAIGFLIPLIITIYMAIMTAIVFVN